MIPVPTIAQLVIAYPELEGASVDYPEFLQFKLDEAAAETGDEFPNPQAQLSYCLTMAAYMIYQSPVAMKVGLTEKNGPKAEGLRLALMRKAQVATMGLRVF